MTFPNALFLYPFVPGTTAPPPSPLCFDFRRNLTIFHNVRKSSSVTITLHIGKSVLACSCHKSIQKCFKCLFQLCLLPFPFLLLIFTHKAIGNVHSSTIPLQRNSVTHFLVLSLQPMFTIQVLARFDVVLCLSGLIVWLLPDISIHPSASESIMPCVLSQKTHSL